MVANTPLAERADYLHARSVSRCAQQKACLVAIQAMLMECDVASLTVAELKAAWPAHSIHASRRVSCLSSRKLCAKRSCKLR